MLGRFPIVGFLCRAGNARHLVWNALLVESLEEHTIFTRFTVTFTGPPLADCESLDNSWRLQRCPH